MTWNGPFLVGVDVVWMPLMGCAPQCICLKHADILVRCIRFYIPTPLFLPNLLFLFCVLPSTCSVNRWRWLLHVHVQDRAGFPFAQFFQEWTPCDVAGSVCVELCNRRCVDWSPGHTCNTLRTWRIMKEESVAFKSSWKAASFSFGILGSCQYRQLMCFALV